MTTAGGTFRLRSFGEDSEELPQRRGFDCSKRLGPRGVRERKRRSHTCPGPLSSALNKKFDQWASTDKGLFILTKLQLPQELKKEDIVPSRGVLEKIAGAVAPESTPASLTGNNLRKQVLLKYWDNPIAPVLAERLHAILQQGQSDATYTPRLAFVVQMIIEQPDVLEVKYSPQLWSYIQSIYGRYGDPPVRMEIHRAVLVFAATCPDANTKQTATSFAQQNWQTFADNQLREILEFLSKFGEQSRQVLQTALVQQELTAAQNELQNPTDRTKQRIDLCIEKHQLLASKSLDSLLLKALQTSDSAFNTWRITVAEYSAQLGQDFALQVADQCLSLVTGSHTPARRQGFFELFATVLPNVNPDAKPRLLQAYLALCKHSDGNLRNPAATILGKVQKEVDGQDFKIGLNVLMRELCRMSPSELVAYRPIFDAILEHSVLFGDYEWRDLGDLGKRSVQQSEPSLQDYGLSLLERIPKLPEEHAGDIIHLLIGIARDTNSGLRERADKFLRKIPESGLGAKSKQALQEYLNPKKEDA